MSDYKSDYKLEEDEKPFAVADYLDEPAAIEARIGDLQVEIQRLQALLADIAAIAARG